jgi:hypothetical protein
MAKKIIENNRFLAAGKSLDKLSYFGRACCCAGIQNVQPNHQPN